MTLQASLQLNANHWRRVFATHPYMFNSICIVHVHSFKARSEAKLSKAEQIKAGLWSSAMHFEQLGCNIW